MPKPNLNHRVMDALRHRCVKPVFQTRDEYGDIFVYEQSGKRVLTFDERFEQSAMDIKQPAKPAHRYVRTMLLVMAFTRPSHALHLGLGGGALIRAVAHLVPECRHTAVELRPGVKLIAEQYFLSSDYLCPSTHLAIFCDNARRFVHGQPAGKYDVIFSDIYLANGMDVNQKSRHYLADCAALLNDRGWLVLNFTQLPAFDDPGFQVLGAHFKEVLIASSDAANFVILACKSALEKPLTAYAPEVKRTSDALSLNLMDQFKHLLQFRDFFRHQP